MWQYVFIPDNIIKVLIYIFTPICFIIVLRKPRRLRGILPVVIFIPLMLGWGGAMIGQTNAYDHMFKAGGAADPSALSGEIAYSNLNLLLGWLGTMVIAIGMLFVPSLRRKRKATVQQSP